MYNTGILGIPPTNGLIPQAPLHTQSLTVTRLVPHPSDSSRRIEEVVKVYEQRVSNFMQAILIGIMAFPPFLGIIGLVPTSALDGKLLCRTFTLIHSLTHVLIAFLSLQASSCSWE